MAECDKFGSHNGKCISHYRQSAKSNSQQATTSSKHANVKFDPSGIKKRCTAASRWKILCKEDNCRARSKKNSLCIKHYRASAQGQQSDNSIGSVDEMKWDKKEVENKIRYSYMDSDLKCRFCSQTFF